MKTIELSAALNNAAVKETLKNFVGVDETGNMGLMTPERLAAVAGDKLGIYVNDNLVSVPNVQDGIEIAKALINALPITQEKPVFFEVLFMSSGRHYAYGFIYNRKMHGVVNIMTLYGNKYVVTINNGNYKVV